ncbi:beta-N-acetylhexosaminidase [Paenibacillus luteus]|uniref:beta-N-acetylhexosaminidase n=1 Tax=Paenibacillus luteus TaxID=2545753 RepID=UPI00114255BD|nr:beta-N-acetylhexosaminidase [Paenibacillus luteus]
MSRHQQVFSFFGEIGDVNGGIDILCNRLGVKRLVYGGWPVTLERRESTLLVVIIEEAGAIIRYTHNHHLFRALGLLVESIRENRFQEIREELQFDTIGMMMDCSRNAVPTVESVKDLLVYMALIGMNTLMLYTEDTYTITAEPYFGYMRGRYTERELQECDDFAARLGIELIPCIQTLAHLESFLKWEASAPLRDSNDVLLVGLDQTYQLIHRMVESVSRCFRSRRIHIGMDEAQGLGRGRGLDLYGNKNRFELMNEHLLKVKEITMQYGLEPMIWSDMYFRIGSATHEYYDLETVISRAHADQIPRGTQLVYWDYYHYDQEFYAAMIRKHKGLGSVPIFAGGIWSWVGMCTHYTRTFKCSNAALLACKQEGVREVFVTAWGDNGAENAIETLLPGMQYYAEHAYARVLDEHKLQQRISFCTGVPYEHFMNIEWLDHIPDMPTPHEDFSNPSKFLLWQDVLMGLFDKHVENVALSAHYGRLAELFREQGRVAGEQAKLLFSLHASLSDVLRLKADLGLRLRKAYKEGDRIVLAQIAEDLLPELLLNVEALRISHRKQWMKTNKPQGWEILDIRYGGLLARLESAQARIVDFLEGTIIQIEELEEERIYFDNRLGAGGIQADYYTTYHLIASANKFT